MRSNPITAVTVTKDISILTLTGTYRSSNRGDAAMQLVALEQLGSPGRKVVVDSPFPDFDASTYGRDRVVACGRRSGPRILYQTVLAALCGLLRKLRVPGADRLLLTEELRHLGRKDGLVVDLSGDMLTEDYGFLVGFSHFVPLIQAQLTGTPVVVCAQSVGPFSKLSPLARLVLSRAALVTLRDEISRTHLADLGLDAEVNADVAFLLDPDAEAATGVLRRHGLLGERFLAVSVSPIVESRFESTEATQSFAEVVSQGLEPAVEAGIRIVFVPHVTGPGADKDDREVAARVAAKLGGDSVVIVEEMDPKVTKGVIGNAVGIVGCRMHANIAALSQAVPVVALSYSHKTPGIMAALGQEDLVMDGKELTSPDLAGLVSQLLEERDVRSGEIASRLPSVRERAQRNFVAIEDLISSSGRSDSREMHR